jgi:hypothetical protein
VQQLARALVSACPEFKRVACQSGVDVLTTYKIRGDRAAQSWTVGGTHLVLGSVRGRGPKCASAGSGGLTMALVKFCI